MNRKSMSRPSAAKSEPMPVMPPGYDATSGHFGGPLYHINLGIPGQPAAKTNLSVSSAQK